MSANAIPEGFNTVSVHMVVKGAAKAMDFYKEAFGAKELSRLTMPGSDLIMHASMKIGDSTIMLMDDMPLMEYWVEPGRLKGTAVGICLYVKDADAAFNQAIEAGAQVAMALHDAFWGDRYGKVRDPFGHEWEISSHQKDLTPEQIAEGAKQFFAAFNS